MALHVLFYFSDSLPFLQTIFSLACHVVYLQNFSSTWPLISLTSPTFLASCALVIADHFIWFFYFARITSEVRHTRAYRAGNTHVPGFAEIASFFAICVWFTPLFLFLSLSANDNAIPTVSGKTVSFLWCFRMANFFIAEPLSPTAASALQTGQARVPLLRSIFSFFSLDGTYTRLRPRASRNDTSEGIIAPRSPNLPRSPLPQRSGTLPSSPSLRPTMYPPPPRSPGPRVQELDLASSTTNARDFRLDTPSGRLSARRGTGGESQGLGISLRRTASYMGDDR